MRPCTVSADCVGSGTAVLLGGWGAVLVVVGLLSRGTRGGSPLDQSLGTTVVLYVLQWWGPATGLCELVSADMVLWLPCGAASCWLHA